MDPSSTSASPTIFTTASSMGQNSVITPIGAVQNNLKRSASKSFDDDTQDDSSRKRLKEDMADTEGTGDAELLTVATTTLKFHEELWEELQCGCCSEICYRPVLVLPCQHFFCGACCVLWIRNGGSNCPACRSISTSVIPFRALQSVIDLFLRVSPERARTKREQEQADELYRQGSSLRLPVPREASPEPNIVSGALTDYMRPCPHCSTSNPYGWRCPNPIPDPNTDPDHAWPVEDGMPPGHSRCGNCENLLAINAPTTTKCDFCQVSFCGIGIQSRCLASNVLSQHPHGMAEVGDLIQSQDVYDCFSGNAVEVDIMFDYLTAQRITPIHIYREVISFIQNRPDVFKQLLDLELFSDMNVIGTSEEQSQPLDAGHARICRLCATEVLLWGLRDWWIRERQKGFLDPSVMDRKDCSLGNACPDQKNLVHAKEFNHIISPPAHPMQVDMPDTENAYKKEHSEEAPSAGSQTMA